MAFVRVGQFRARPETIDDLRRIYETEAIPVIRMAAGNISAVLLQQHEAPDRFMAITIWATNADADTYDQSGTAREMVDKIRFGFAGPPQLTTYEAYGLAAR
jgi:quinol monooxygenase YgiN